MLALGRRAVTLEAELEVAYKLEHDSRQDFYALVGPTPEALRIRGVEAVLLTEREEIGWVNSTWLRRMMTRHPAKSEQGRILRRKLKIALAYEARRDAAKDATGWRAAAETSERLKPEREKIVAAALACRPRTAAGVLAVAQAFTAQYGPSELAHGRSIELKHPLALVEAIVRALDQDHHGELRDPAAAIARAERLARQQPIA